jgi:hypothetical protein
MNFTLINKFKYAPHACENNRTAFRKSGITFWIFNKNGHFKMADLRRTVNKCEDYWVQDSLEAKSCPFVYTDNTDTCDRVHIQILTVQRRSPLWYILWRNRPMRDGWNSETSRNVTATVAERCASCLLSLPLAPGRSRVTCSVTSRASSHVRLQRL